jgi:hypothetical protein
LALYKTAKLITVGKIAQNILNVLEFKVFESIRYPANDFKKEIPKQFKNIYLTNKTLRINICA